MITRQIVADKITEYLHGNSAKPELVDWAERAIMETDFNESDIDLLTDIVGRLGLADVAEFGLRWRIVKNFCAVWGIGPRSLSRANENQLRPESRRIEHHFSRNDRYHQASDRRHSR